MEICNWIGRYVLLGRGLLLGHGRCELDIRRSLSVQLITARATGLDVQLGTEARARTVSLNVRYQLNHPARTAPGSLPAVEVVEPKQQAHAEGRMDAQRNEPTGYGLPRTPRPDVSFYPWQGVVGKQGN